MEWMNNSSSHGQRSAERTERRRLDFPARRLRARKKRCIIGRTRGERGNIYPFCVASVAHETSSLSNKYVVCGASNFNLHNLSQNLPDPTMKHVGYIDADQQVLNDSKINGGTQFCDTLFRSHPCPQAFRYAKPLISFKTQQAVAVRELFMYLRPLCMILSGM